MINKIYIIGGARSGKSFLGKNLSNKTRINHFNLDNVVFIEVGKQRRNTESINEKLNKILLSEKWIIEGAYAENWIVPALKKADMIIWLDTPPLIKLFRFLKQAIKKEKDGFKNFYGRGLLAVGLKYKKWDRSRACYQNLLRPFENKVIILKSIRDSQYF